MKRLSVWFVPVAFVVAGALISADVAPAARSGGPVIVQVAKSRLGQILVDGGGRTLYLFEKDKGTSSTCYGPCAAYWPPLTTRGKPHAARGASAARLGTTKRRDGKLEVTYNGHPLYYFVADTKTGDTSGQALNQFGAEWYVLSPAGRKVEDN
jgi:predicted lipoprotein with Yx(FWY)xxD motif